MIVVRVDFIHCCWLWLCTDGTKNALRSDISLSVVFFKCSSPQRHRINTYFNRINWSSREWAFVCVRGTRMVYSTFTLIYVCPSDGTRSCWKPRGMSFLAPQIVASHFSLALILFLHARDHQQRSILVSTSISGSPRLLLRLLSAQTVRNVMQQIALSAPAGYPFSPLLLLLRLSQRNDARTDTITLKRGYYCGHVCVRPVCEKVAFFLLAKYFKYVS